MGTDVKIASTYFDTPVGTPPVSKDVTIPDLGWTPKAAMFFGSSLTYIAAPWHPSSPSIGWTDGTRQAAIATYNQDNVSTSVCKHCGSTSSCILKITNALTVEGVFDSFIENGVRLSFTTAGAATYVGVIFFGGDDFQAYADKVAVGASLDVTAPGFRPSAVFALGKIADFGGSGSILNTAWLGFGFAADDGSDPPPQRCVSWGFGNGMTGQASSAQYVSSDEIVALPNISGGTVNFAHQVDTFDANGFTFTRTTGSSTRYIAYLAIDLGDFEANIIEAAVPSSTTPQAISGFGFAPTNFVTLSSDHATLDTVVTTDDARSVTSGWGYFDSSASWHMCNSGQIDANPTNSNYSIQMAKVVQIMDLNLGEEAAATVFTWDADGVTLSWSPGTSLVPKVFYLGMESQPAPVEGGTGLPVQAVIG